MRKQNRKLRNKPVNISTPIRKGSLKPILFRVLKYIYKEREIEKVDMLHKVLNKQFIERLRAIFVTNKTQLHTPTDCFTP